MPEKDRLTQLVAPWWSTAVKRAPPHPDKTKDKKVSSDQNILYSFYPH